MKSTLDSYDDFALIFKRRGRPFELPDVFQKFVPKDRSKDQIYFLAAAKVSHYLRRVRKSGLTSKSAEALKNPCEFPCDALAFEIGNYLENLELQQALQRGQVYMKKRGSEDYSKFMNKTFQKLIFCGLSRSSIAKVRSELNGLMELISKLQKISGKNAVLIRGIKRKIVPIIMKREISEEAFILGVCLHRVKRLLECCSNSVPGVNDVVALLAEELEELEPGKGTGKVRDITATPYLKGVAERAFQIDYRAILEEIKYKYRFRKVDQQPQHHHQYPKSEFKLTSAMVNLANGFSFNLKGPLVK